MSASPSQDEEITPHPMMVRGFDRLLTTQRPAVLDHVRNVRRRHPGASPEQVIRILERHYLTAVTTGGAGVGAAAIIPGVGTGISLALTGVETAVFLEASALFAQSITEIHGIAVTDPDRARTIVMAMMLGNSGAELVRSLAAQATGQAVPRTRFWGDVIGRNVPQAFMGPIADRVKRAFLQRFARNTTTGAIGRILPFGIGAVVGGTASHILGRRIVAASKDAFGPAPEYFPANLEQLKPPRTPLVAYVSRGGAALRDGARRLPVPLRKQLPAGPSAAAPGDASAPPAPTTLPMTPPSGQ
ncbi:hypothetical protein FB562_0507 [Homoserinimonas aerilata]|uniref:EcsC family protein n=1 Tax=Homoserinimonas aerilata TaxID=1162970 RepID=A0A542YH88_9MICO|nr:hypothetical protein [Homoserinimonas aerilata]TQL47447.1 hypothetical protein FB562_0507 [Homoserinimonas aerilata]